MERKGDKCVAFERLGVGEHLRVGSLEKVQPPRPDSVAWLDETVVEFNPKGILGSGRGFVP